MEFLRVGINVSVDPGGSIFDGRWAPIMLAYKLHVEEKLADVSVRRIRAYLPTQYMYLGHNGGDTVNNPIPDNAGYLVSQIQWHRESLDTVLVNDGGYPAMIYGPWIEGIAPGNAYYGVAGRTRRGLSPRFPGYHAFQKISYEVQMEAEDIADEILPTYLEMMDE
jgi:hypothetical protein